MLLTRSKSKRALNFAKIIKKRLGIFLDSPGFEVVLLNKNMIDLIKNSVQGGTIYIFLNLLERQ